MRYLAPKAALKEKIFTHLFEEAEIAKFNAEDRREYEDSLKAYRDIKNSIDTALEQGREEGMKKGLKKGLKKGRAEGHAEGRAEGRAEGLEEGRAEGEMEAKRAMAVKFLALGVPVHTIVQATGLTAEEIQSLT